MAKQSYLEREFELMLRTANLSGYEREYKFHPVRKWRIDFAWVLERLAVEVDGGVRTGHARFDNALREAEKAEALLLAGWTLYRIPGPWIVQRDVRVWRSECIETIHALLERARERGVAQR